MDIGIKKSKKSNVIKKDLFTPITAIGLEWCKVLDIESGWVSDNYLAFARVVKWLYHPLIVLQPDEPFVEPTTPVKQWKMNACKEWLNIHGMCNNGKVNEVK